MIVTLLADALCVGVSIGNTDAPATTVMLIQAVAYNALTTF